MISTSQRLMILLIMSCIATSGCKNLFATNESSRNAGHFAKPNTTAEMVALLNRNSQVINSLESDDVDITVTQNGQPFGLNGRLAYQKERNFRMTAGALGSTEADLGSNSQEFWFYMKRNDPPDLFFCSYNDLPQAQIKLPLQPDWIAEALCVQEMNPAEYEMREVKGGYELIKRVQHQGEQLYKGVLVASSGPNAGRVILYRLFKANAGKVQEIWRAEIIDYQDENKIGKYTVPHQVKVSCPEHKVVVEMKLRQCKINQLAGSAQLFQRPPGYRAQDLARIQPGGVPSGPITRVGGQ